jgi:hypothetical protein
MDERPPPERPIEDAREIATDLRYRWNQEKATGDAEALARVHDLAKQAGVPPDQLEQITDGFVAIAQDLIGKRGEKQRRRPLRWPRRKRLEAGGGVRELPPPKRPRQLPPGDPD